jgi:hypothetical protein
MTLLDDVNRLRDKCSSIADRVDVLEGKTDRTHEQINGERGLSKAIDALAVEVANLRRGMYYVAGLIVASSIAFAFSVLVFFV